MTRPLALDLFCGAGGAAAGLAAAGFDVVGVDHKPQPRYPYRFVRADALAPPFELAAFDLIWASPPCQPYTLARNMRAHSEHPDLLDPTRRLLASARALTVIENVPRAPMRPDVKLDGWMFDLRVIRERWFELNFFMLSPPISRPPDLLRKGFLSVIGSGTPPYLKARGYRYVADDCRRAMGIPWMSRAELSQAIPPAYAAHIGRAALQWITSGEAA